MSDYEQHPAVREMKRELAVARQREQKLTNALRQVAYGSWIALEDVKRVTAAFLERDAPLAPAVEERR